MKVIKPSFEIVAIDDGLALLKRLEAAGRVCYKLEDKITDGSAAPFAGLVLKSGYFSVI